jgi:PAS domain S-box-containing protein
MLKQKFPGIVGTNNFLSGQLDFSLGSRRAEVAIIALGLAIALLVFATFSISNRAQRIHHEADELLSNSGHEVALSHLWLEEAITSDTRVDFNEKVLGNLDSAALRLQRAIDNANTSTPAFIAPADMSDSQLRFAVQLHDKLKTIRALTIRRWTDKLNSQPGNPIDQAYDLAFEEFEALIQRSVLQLNEQRDADEEWIRRIYLVLGVLLAASTFIALILFRRSSIRADLVRAELERQVKARTAELAKSESRFRLLTEMSAEWIWEQDEQFRFTEMSKSHQLEMPEVMGRCRWDLPAPNLTEADWEAHRSMLCARLPFKDFEIQRILKNGKSVWRSASGIPVFNDQGEFKGYRGVTRDITQRKLAEEKVKESLLQLEQIMEISPVGIFLVDAQRKVLRCNRTFEQMLGCEKGEFLGRTTRDILGDEKYQDIGSRGYTQLRDEGILRTEIEYLRKDGSRSWGLLQGIQFDKSDPESRKLFVVTDIAAEKSAEAELRKARDAAEAANRAKSSFLAMISHEIRTPMNAISGMIELASLRSQDTEQKGMLDIAMSSSQALLRIINDLLDISKIQAGKFDLQPGPTPVAPLIESVRATFSAKAAERHLLLKTLVDPGLAPLLLVDGDRLRQVLFNLVSNAIKFTEQGSVEIRAHVLSENGAFQTLRIEVIDSGIGIPMKDQGQLFSPFVQVGGNHSGGTGLGLSISKSLCELMGGSIDLHSRPGFGTTAAITLPLRHVMEVDAARTEAQLRQLTLTTQGFARGGRILIVDDSPINVMLLTHQISALGYETESAENGKLGLEKWLTGKFALVIADCLMPVMDGFELARRIRAHEQLQGDTNRTPILAYSANVSQSDVQQCLAAGMDDILGKPLLLETLRLALRTWTGGSPSPAH